MKDSQYRDLVSNWREAFEEQLVNRSGIKEGDNAIYSINSRIPFSGYVFNLPNYKHLPVTPSAYDPTYGYIVEDVRSVDRVTLNRVEAIVCDSKFCFTCVFNQAVSDNKCNW